jgi:adenosylcobinamide-phosphate synthase
MTPFLSSLFFAFVLDVIIGDPETKYHPIRFIGWLIKKGEVLWYRPSIPRQIGGIILVVETITATFAVVFGIFAILFSIAPIWGWLWTIFLLYICLAFRSLIDAGRRIADDLGKNRLVLAREHLSRIVSRDTAELDEHDVIRGTIESLSENLNDAVMAPLFYALLFGVPGIVLYKTVNTLDSMIGYKSEKYLKFGWCAARLDDILNFIPARLTFLFVLAGAALLRYDVVSTWKTVLKYSQTGESPNGGIGICAFAGALHITLGGTNYINGKLSVTPSVLPVDAESVLLSMRDIRRSERLIIASTLIGLVVSISLLCLFSGIL